MIAKKIIFLFYFLFAVNSFSAIDVKHRPVPGGVALINFNSNYTNPKAFYNNIELYVQKLDDNHWQALIGIPLYEKLGKKQITIKDYSAKSIEFEVVSATYKEQYITLTGDKKKYVNPLIKHMDRIKKERPILASARKTFSNVIYGSGKFIKPSGGIKSSEFGLKRFYNLEPRRPHTGLDYAADEGSLITAPQKGKVILTGNYFFNGNTVFLDHGKGLISVYIHMSKISVKKDQILKKGDVIGLVGKTGRATGPHLHWGIYLNSTAVNPELFL